MVGLRAAHLGSGASGSRPCTRLLTANITSSTVMGAWRVPARSLTSWIGGSRRPARRAGSWRFRDRGAVVYGVFAVGQPRKLMLTLAFHRETLLVMTRN